MMGKYSGRSTLVNCRSAWRLADFFSFIIVVRDDHLDSPRALPWMDAGDGMNTIGPISHIRFEAIESFRATHKTRFPKLPVTPPPPACQEAGFKPEISVFVLYSIPSFIFHSQYSPPVTHLNAFVPFTRSSTAVRASFRTCSSPAPSAPQQKLEPSARPQLKKGAQLQKSVDVGPATDGLHQR